VACRDGSELGPPAETCLPVEAHNAKDVSCHSWDGYCDALVRHRVDKCSELSMVWAARRRFDQLRLCQLRAMPGEKQLVRSQPHVSAADRGAAVTPQAEWASRKTVTVAPFEDAARGGRPRCLCGQAREIAPATLSSTLRNSEQMRRQHHVPVHAGQFSCVSMPVLLGEEQAAFGEAVAWLKRIPRAFRTPRRGSDRPTVG
jgi:hypothetical protein